MRKADKTKKKAQEKKYEPCELSCDLSILRIPTWPSIVPVPSFTKRARLNVYYDTIFLEKRF